MLFLPFIFLGICLSNWVDVPVVGTLGGFFVNLYSIDENLKFPLMVDTAHHWAVFIGKDCTQVSTNSSCLPNASKFSYLPSSSSYLNWSAPHCNNITRHQKQYCGLYQHNFSMTANNGFKVSFGNQNFSSSIGVIYEAPSSFIQSINNFGIYGMLGLGISSTQEVIPSFLETYFGIAKSSPFYSLCLGPVEGHLLLGGSDMRYKQKLIGNIPTPSFNIDSISIANDTLINISSVIKASIDSSQVDVKFSKNLFESFYATFLQTRCDHLPYLPCASNVNINTTIFSVNGECFSLTKDVIPTYPNITIKTSDGLTLRFGPEFYFKTVTNYWGVICIQLALSQSTDLPDNTIVFGSSWMRQYYMEFNLTSQNLAIYEPNQTFCGKWEIGLPGGGSMFLNFVVIGSIFGFMILSMGSYIFYTACIEKQPEYIHIQ